MSWRDFALTSLAEQNPWNLGIKISQHCLLYLSGKCFVKHCKFPSLKQWDAFSKSEHKDEYWVKRKEYNRETERCQNKTILRLHLCLDKVISSSPGRAKLPLFQVLHGLLSSQHSWQGAELKVATVTLRHNSPFIHCEKHFAPCKLLDSTTEPKWTQYF